MSAPLPIRIYRPLHRQCLFRRSENRSFSTTSAHPARHSAARKRRTDPVQTEAAARHQGGKASSTVYEEQLSNERNLPDDIGMIPGTFIRAPLRPFSRFSLRERAWYEWKWLVSKTKAWILLSRYKRSIASRPKVNFWLWDHPELCSKAKEKYTLLYQSFAKGDSNAISQICLSSVTKQFNDRIAARPDGLKMQWKADGPVNIRVVSNRAVPLSFPGYEDTGVHQVVFRLQSKQTLERNGPSGGLGYTPKSGNVVEYLVMQRQMVRNTPKDWMIWGFADESTPQSIREDEEYERKVNKFQTA